MKLWFNGATGLAVRNTIFKLLLALVILPACSALVTAAQDAHTIKIELYPQGQHTNPAVLYVVGERYQASPAIPVPLRDFHDVTPEIKFLSQLISTNTNGTLEDVLKLWDPQDREAIRAVASDPTIFEGNKKFYKSIVTSRLLAKISYGTYDILFVQHNTESRTVIKDYPVTRVNGVLMNTNALQGDPMFVYLSTKYTQMLTQNPAAR